MKVIAVIVALAVASSAAAQTPTTQKVEPASLMPITYTKVVPASSYGVTVYAFFGYDANANPPFILEPAKEVENEVGARAYAQFKLDPGYTVVEYCRAVQLKDGRFVLPYTREERLLGRCMVYGYVPPKHPSWQDLFNPLIERIERFFKPKPTE